MKDPRFWQASDMVPPKVIQTVAKTCASEYCKFSAKKLSGDNCMGSISYYYDKNGILQVDDRNIFEVEICCKMCSKGWVVDQNGNIKDVAEMSMGTNNYFI